MREENEQLYDTAMQLIADRQAAEATGDLEWLRRIESHETDLERRRERLNAEITTESFFSAVGCLGAFAILGWMILSMVLG